MLSKNLALNILTFDIEEWYQANYPGLVRESGDFEDTRLEENICRLLELCQQHQAKATFFILGTTAEKYPSLVPMIKSHGHEIACHGYHHNLIYNLSPSEFDSELKRALQILESQAGEKIIGFRAPSWSIRKDMIWFFSLLEKYGLVYDSSLFPLKTFLYGEKRANPRPHFIGQLLELPPSTINISLVKIPFSGGFYFRVLPYFLIKKGIKRLNEEGLPAIVYLHPREIDPNSPRLPLPLKPRFIHYFGLKRALAKFQTLLRDFRFTSIRDYFGFSCFDKGSRFH